MWLCCSCSSMAIMRRLTVCVRATNVCVTHTEGDVINNLPHPLMMMNLIILRKKWSGQNRTGRTGSAATVHCRVRLLSACSYHSRWQGFMCPRSSILLWQRDSNKRDPLIWQWDSNERRVQQNNAAACMQCREVVLKR